MERLSRALLRVIVFYYALLAGKAGEIGTVIGLVFVVAGLAFKLGVVPFHMWIPDVYHGAPTAVTLLVAGAPKLARHR